MRSIYRSASLLFLLTIALFALTGCGSKDPRPAPGDTVIGSPYGSSQDGFISGDNVYSEQLRAEQLNANGLTPRGDASSYLNNVAGASDAHESIYFGFDQYSVAPDQRAKLEEVANYLRSNPSVRIVCEGHTDWFGTVEYNLGLGDRRASAVKNYLVQLGIPASRIESLSLGKLEAAEGASKGDQAAINDRRVDIVLAR